MTRAQLQMKAESLKPWRRECEAVTLTLPFPVSVNQMYFNNIYENGGRGRGDTELYRKWKFQAALEVMRQRSGRVDGPVHVAFTVEEKKGRRDGDNCCKCMFDLLVAQGVIDADDSKTVRAFSFAWSSEVTGARVEIRREGLRERPPNGGESGGV